ncbi:iron-sulfur cluster biosynthesis family protein [Bacillus sp. 1P06AnD]|uniref:iron-sulfur cluster biosynthesis family protein n=1 Tax=Bacillus sp. 1P06AnD TaxID=3132208 RepID=UPI0039A0B630
MWDQEAEEQITKMTDGKQGYLKLIYDNEDCGCSDGVTTLWFIADPEGNEIQIETSVGPLLVDKDQLTYLEEDMQIVWVPDFNSFRLKTNDGIINPFMKFYNWVK